MHMQVPGKEVRHRLTDAQWQTALNTWRTAVVFDSPIHQQEKTNFVLAYFAAAVKESQDRLADDSRKVKADRHLAEAVHNTALKLPIASLLQKGFLINLATTSPSLLERLAQRHRSELAQYVKDKYLKQLASTSEDSTDATTESSSVLQQDLEGITLLAQSPTFATILAEADLATSLVNILETHKLDFNQRKAVLRTSLQVMRSPGQRILQRGLRSALQQLGSLALAENCQALLTLTFFVIDRSPTVVEAGQLLTETWKIGCETGSMTTSQKGKGRAANDSNDASRAELASLVSEIKSLLPDLDDSFVERCLQHYSGNTEETLAHLLDGDVPEHLKTANGVDQPPARSQNMSQVWSSDSLELPERRNIYDNDEFDRLEHDKAHVLQRGSRDAAQQLDTAAVDKGVKQKVLALAFDPDDDEVDDTYDEIDAVGVPGQQADDELDADEVAQRNNMAEQALVLALEVDPSVFQRQNRKSAARAQLRGQTNMSDEQIEGWKSMLDRQPKRLQALMSKYEFSGEQQQVDSSKWQHKGHDGATVPPSEIRGGLRSRGGGASDRGASSGSRGRGRGKQVSGQGNSRRPIDPERRNRRNLREKKLARGVND
ncbi:hypothetical protein PYCC9005_003787 [Savitreella phatthalungensis]